MVHLPCFILETLGIPLNPAVESMWAHCNSSDYLLVIVIDKEGIANETFKQPILGGDTIYPNASYKNQQFNGRVDVSASRGLVINNVQSSDAGKFLCLYRDTETKVRGHSEVELIVFNGSNNTSCSLNETKGNNADHENGDDAGNSDTNSSWKVLATVFIVLFCVVSIVAIALGVVSCKLYLARCERHQSIPQIGNADGMEENCVANGSTVRYDNNSQGINDSPRFNRADGNEGNRVTIVMNGSPCIY